MGIISGIKAFTGSAAVQLPIAILATASAADDLIADLGGPTDLFGLDVHHGMFVLAAVHALKTLCDLVDGMQKVEDTAAKVVKKA